MRKGFTLVEILLAISIFSILAVSIYSVFNIGITAWRKMEAMLERYQELRFLMDRMGLELRNCLDLDAEIFLKNLPIEIYDFQGTSNRMFFYTLKNGEIKRIFYIVEKDRVTDTLLLKRYEKEFSPYLFKEEELKNGEIVFDLVKEMSFNYFKKSDTEEIWKGTWGEDTLERKNLPSQVKIKFTFYVPTITPVSRKVDYQEASIEKYVDIVCAPKKLSP